jgi:hypothetical protein
VAQVPGQKGAFVPDSSEPRRVDTKPVTTDAPLPVCGTRQGIYCPIAATWGWLTRAMLPGRRAPPYIPPSQGGMGISPPIRDGSGRVS